MSSNKKVNGVKMALNQMKMLNDLRKAQKALAKEIVEVGSSTVPALPCGYRRVHAALARRGVETSPDTVRSVMPEQGLEAAQPRRKARRHRPRRQ